MKRNKSSNSSSTTGGRHTHLPPHALALVRATRASCTQAGGSLCRSPSERTLPRAASSHPPPACIAQGREEPELGRPRLPWHTRNDHGHHRRWARLNAAGAADWHQGAGRQAVCLRVSLCSAARACACARARHLAARGRQPARRVRARWMRGICQPSCTLHAHSMCLGLEAAIMAFHGRERRGSLGPAASSPLNPTP